VSNEAKYNFNMLKPCLKNVDKLISNYIIESNNIIWSELNQLKLTVNYKKISIKQIYEEVIGSSSMDFIFAYHKILFNGIMKLICKKIKTMLEIKETIDTKTADFFKNTSFLY